MNDEKLIVIVDTLLPTQCLSFTHILHLHVSHLVYSSYCPSNIQLPTLLLLSVRPALLVCLSIEQWTGQIQRSMPNCQ